VTFVEIIPIHFINTDCKDLLILWVDSGRYNSPIEQFIDVQASCMSVVKD